ncbi:MAG: response regulator transcription factor [Flavobacteriales bacterium]|nr:response regulator transcription factor [Flavobacteriales bacterium]
MTAVIIDDEAKARLLLKTILEDYCEEIDTIYDADGLKAGVKLIREHLPDVVFLDVEMPEHMGTQINDFFAEDEINFKIVFTTAHSEYAVKAFELNAIDYLLKPMRPKQVREAVSKVYAERQQKTVSKQLVELRDSFNTLNFKKIGLPVSDGILFVELEDIICMEADGMYTKFYTKNSGSKMVSKPLKHFMELLEENKEFYRPHRSYCINMRYIKQYVKKDGGYLVMDNDVMVSISREKREEFLHLMSSF